MRRAGPSQASNSAPCGGSDAAKPRAWGNAMRRAGPSQASNSAPCGGSDAAKPRAWGEHTSAGESSRLLRALSRRTPALPRHQQGKWGYIVAWLVGIPVPILIVIFLLRGCT